MVINIKTISLCMIVKDEENIIEKCLLSIKDVVDEIIIVDTGSNDNTIKICEKYTHKIFNYKWINDFSKARNYSLSKATCEYILWLDADDYLCETEIKKLKDFKNNLDDSIDIYYFLYEFNDEYAPFYRERVFKNNGKYYFVGRVHEAIIPNGKTKCESIIIKQQKKEIKDISRNLKIYETIEKRDFSSRDYYYYGKELLRNKKFNKAMYYLTEFLKQKTIYIEDAIDACFELSNLHIITSNNSSALKYLLMSFEYDLPRPNILCKIGDIYFNIKDYNKAIFYYDLALKRKNNNKSFILKDYLGYYPSIMLCLCYDKLKNYNIANKYNELANTYKNIPKIYEHNKQYFQSMLK